MNKESLPPYSVYKQSPGPSENIGLHQATTRALRRQVRVPSHGGQGGGLGVGEGVGVGGLRLGWGRGRGEVGEGPVRHRGQGEAQAG